MKSNHFSQVLYEMKHQPVIGIVTVIGTALAIFLIMIVVMMHLVTIVPFSPESNRDRTLYGKYINIADIEGDGSSSASMTYSIAKRLFGDLESAENVSYFTDTETTDISVVGSTPSIRSRKNVDSDFWKIFDYEFIHGRPFSEEEFEAGMHVAIVAESVAREMYNTSDVCGQEILVTQIPYKIVGVVKDASPLASTAFSDVFLLISANDGLNRNWSSEYFGPYHCAILAGSSSDFPKIREEIQVRKNIFNNELAKDNKRYVDHGSPFIQEYANIQYSNGDPDTSAKTRRYVIYVILLIVPAINLSSMTQSRLRRKMSEIGVRRAYGCTRWRIIKDVLVENFIVTIAGGILGLLLCLFFGLFYSDMVFTEFATSKNADISLSMLFNWQVFTIALLFCLILNILSSGIPAWRASRVDPVTAINSRNI